jgi:hypothetical protein
MIPETKEKLIEFLVKEWDYQPNQAPETAEKIIHLESGIKAAFDSWRHSGEIPDQPEYSGFSPKRLQQLCPLKPPAIFLLLDWVRREPQNAMQAIKDEFVKK